MPTTARAAEVLTPGEVFTPTEAARLDAAAGDRAARLARLDRLSRLLDTAFVLPGTRFRFGADALIGLVPGVGDAVGAALSAYIVHQAWRLGAPRALLLRMIANVGVEAAVGSVPLLGDLFDAAFKANRRNVALLRAAFPAEYDAATAPRR